MITGRIKAIDEAIKVLQDNGYEVFNKLAGLHVAVENAVDTDLLSSKSRGSSYLEAVRDDSARKIGQHLYERNLLKFERILPNTAPSEFRWPRLVERVDFEFFPSVRKEYRR